LKTEELHQQLLNQISGPVTVGSLVHVLGELLATQDLYYGHGTDNPHDEAFALIFAVLGLDHDEPGIFWDQQVSKSQVDAVIAVADKRINERMPLPYLTGEAWFAGLRFVTDPRALIPRSPFAELIQNEYAPWLRVRAGMRVLDMCTGNGCIGIATAVYLSDVMVDLVDISSQALELARTNVELHDVGDRVQIIQSDLFQELEGNRYDLIVSNPPYVPASSMAELPVEYRHEPTLALQADDGGLDIVDRLLGKAADYMSDDGMLIVEVGEIADKVQRHYPVLPFVWLDFEYGGEGVFLLYKQDLVNWRNGKSKNG
jgi:ribosomal protein L3 glutamine methyltransferase